MLRLYKYSFILLTLCISLFINDIQACEVSFTHNAIGNNGAVQFTATSLNATYPTSFEWDFGDANLGHQQNMTHTYSSSGTYTVCLTLIDGNNCLDHICQEITVTNQNSDNCALYDCVYPGDTDGDGAANIYDIFSIGMHYGFTGPVRPYATENWTAQPSQDWPQICYGANLKHADCNGDGIINNADLDPILSNYYTDHSYQSTPNNNPSAPSVLLEFSMDSIVVPDDNPGMFDVSVDVKIGTPYNPVNNIYALALSIDFSDDLILPGSITVDYDDASFFCDTENVLTLSKVANDGLIDIAFSRTNQSPISGFGRVARVNFTIIGDIVVSRNPDNNELPLAVETRGVLGISQHGMDLGFTSHGDVITFQIDENSSLKENIKDNLFSLSPNPSTGLVRLNFEQYSINEFKVYNTTGQLMRQGYISDPNSFDLDLSDLANGTYIIKVSNDNETSSKRVVISK